MKDRSKRQSFLGAHSDVLLANTRIAIVGVSGGGSPIAQQAAHIGFGITHLIDPDLTEVHHQHRLVGISSAAVRHGWKKVRVAERLMKRVHPEGVVVPHPQPWQQVHEVLRSCDLVFACLDGYLARDELERYLRRFDVPLIDIGMDVSNNGEGGYSIVGQIILSMPGSHCLRCFGFVRDELLKEEAARYGEAGERAQVIWPNGVLASTAMGMAMQLLTPWRPSFSTAPYLVYDGDTLTIAPSPRLAYVSNECLHFSTHATRGDVMFGLHDSVSAA